MQMPQLSLSHLIYEDMGRTYRGPGIIFTFILSHLGNLPQNLINFLSNYCVIGSIDRVALTPDQSKKTFNFIKNNQHLPPPRTKCFINQKSNKSLNVNENHMQSHSPLHWESKRQICFP